MGGIVYEELRKRMIDVCLQEVRWRGQGARMPGVKGRRYKQWWSLGVMVKGELCEKVVEVRRVSDRVITVVVFEEGVLMLICGYDPQSGRSWKKNSLFMMS